MPASPALEATHVSAEPEQLKPALERAQHELGARLNEACTEHAPDESTGELIKLEELLSDAAQAAKEAISIRRRLGVERERRAAIAQNEQPARGPDEGVREFVDTDGRAWQVWEVPPEQLSARSRPGAYAGDYESGWLAFESPDGGERRRLPHYPRHWRELDATSIERLCQEARPVTKRRRPKDEPRADEGTGSAETDPA